MKSRQKSQQWVRNVSVQAVYLMLQQITLHSIKQQMTHQLMPQLHDNVAEESTHSDKGLLKWKSTNNTQSNTKRSKYTADDEIKVNRCCVCFGMYADDAGTGREWIECRCSRRIHEDCIDNDNVDIEQCVICPLC